LHGGDDLHLADGPLAALERSLPPGEFARILRTALVWMERVDEVKGLGRGDALLRLINGVELRLSRRSRGNPAALLQFARASHPAGLAGRPPLAN
jgi:DNA-binding LytR/AlgR family response regulator